MAASVLLASERREQERMGTDRQQLIGLELRGDALSRSEWIAIETKGRRRT